MNQINFFQRRDFGEIVGVAFQFAKQNFFHYLVNMMLLNIPIIVLLIASGMYIFNNLSIETFLSAIRFGGFGSVIGFIVIFFLLGLLWLSYTSAISYNYYLLYSQKGEKQFSLQDLFSAAVGSVMRIFVANLFLGLMVLVALILFGGLMGLLMRGYETLAGLFLIVLGVYFGIKMLFFQLIVVREKLNFFAAINRSFQIIKGNWWQTFGLVIVFGIIGFLVSYIVNFVLGILGLKLFDATAILMGREIPQIGIFAIVIFAVAQILISVLTNMFSQTAIFAQYGNLLEEKEGVGLKEKVEQIGKTSDNQKDEEDF